MMDIEVKTEITKNNRKKYIMTPLASSYEGECYVIELYKIFQNRTVLLGVFRGIVGVDLTYHYLSDVLDGHKGFVSGEYIGFKVCLKIKDKKIEKHFT